MPGIRSSSAWAALAMLAGCLGGPPDDIGKTSRLEWRSSGALELCVGDTIRVAVTRLLADTAKNEWSRIDTDYVAVVLRIEDASVAAAGESAKLAGLRQGATAITAIDTSHGLETPRRTVTVSACPAPESP